MDLSKNLRAETIAALQRAWAALGIPLDVSMVQEKKEGVIDIEALLVITSLVMQQDRMATDIPAWVAKFRHVINHHKLKSLLKSSPGKFRKALLENTRQFPFFTACPESFRKIFRLQGVPSREFIETIDMRSGKLNSLENVAHNSFMLKNRLLFGTGYRADLISLLHIRNMKTSGKHLARLLSTADSTISRILSDLRACGFLNSDNEMVKKAGTFPGMLVSTRSVWNLYELLDAEEFREKELKNATYENLDFKHDRFCAQLV